MAALTDHIHVRFTRFSAFYTPLLLTLSSKSLQRNGIKVTYDKATPERTVDQGFQDGYVQLGQGGRTPCLGCQGMQPTESFTPPGKRPQYTGSLVLFILNIHSTALLLRLSTNSIKTHTAYMLQ